MLVIDLLSVNHKLTGLLKLNQMLLLLVYCCFVLICPDEDTEHNTRPKHTVNNEINPSNTEESVQ